MTQRRNTLLLSAVLWLSIFLVDMLSACSFPDRELAILAPQAVSSFESTQAEENLLLFPAVPDI